MSVVYSAYKHILSTVVIYIYIYIIAVAIAPQFEPWHTWSRIIDFDFAQSN